MTDLYDQIREVINNLIEETDFDDIDDLNNKIIEAYFKLYSSDNKENIKTIVSQILDTEYNIDDVNTENSVSNCSCMSFLFNSKL